MALTDKQKQILSKYTSGTENSDPDIQRVAQIRASIPQTGGLMTDIKDIGTNIKESALTRKAKVGKIQQSNVGGLRGAFQAAGQAAGLASDVIGSTVMGGIKALTPEFIQKPVGQAFEKGVETVVNTETAQQLIQGYQNLPEERKRDIESILGIGSLATDIAGAGLLKKPVTQGVKKGAEIAGDIIKATPRVTEKLSTITKESIKPSVTPEKAIGEVLQGKSMTPTQTKSAIETIKQVDTKGIKTFADLDKKLTDKIPELAKKVDEDLGQDTTKYSLDDLKVVKQSKGGKPVELRFVDDALAQLDELYGQTGDLVQQQNIKELRQLARAEGLTRLEVNDIARTYGREFSEKAFGKTGEPLTSVNAQRFETVRKGLKEIARAGIKGADAKKADELMSRIYNIQRLVKKNVEKVNTLMNKIEERGLLEKIGNKVSKYADVLTGGSLRGVVGGLLPRGAGYKTLNAIDLESLLERNLKIIQEASKAKTTKQFNKKIKELNFDLKQTGKNIIKATTGTTMVGGDE